MMLRKCARATNARGLNLLHQVTFTIDASLEPLETYERALK